MSDFRSLRISQFWVVLGGGEHAFPGMDGLVSLSSLSFEETPTLTHFPTTLWRLTQLQCLTHNLPHCSALLMTQGSLPRTALPAELLQQCLNLQNQGFESFPHVVTQLAALTLLSLSGNHFDAGFTSLSALVDMDLGCLPSVGSGGSADARVLGSLSAFSKAGEAFF